MARRISKINRHDLTYVNATSHSRVLSDLALTVSKLKVEAIAALTNNSGGNATPTGGVKAVAAFVNAANASTNLAQKAATETALGKVKDAITELATKANAMATVLSLPTVTDSSGGASADGTIAALDLTTTAATTGSQATETNAIRLVINDAFIELAALVNRICKATDVTELTITKTDFAQTADGLLVTNKAIAAVSTSTGTAADPGITKAAMDAALAVWGANVAYIATKLNEIRTVAPNKVVVV